MIVGRDGGQRLWDLAERRFTRDEPRLPAAELARRVLERQLRAAGVAQARSIGLAWHRRPPGTDRAFAALEREGVAVPVKINGMAGDWYTHAELLARRSFRPRTVLLSPFDDLISDRRRTEQLFGFHYRIEIYVPKAKRKYGYYVLPILHGEQLVGRVDPRFDKATKVLNIQAVWSEPDAPADAGRAVAGAIDELATWLGARDITHAGPAPSAWKRALRA
jgi:uncharacterized protein